MKNIQNIIIGNGHQCTYSDITTPSIDYLLWIPFFILDKFNQRLRSGLEQRMATYNNQKFL